MALPEEDINNILSPVFKHTGLDIETNKYLKGIQENILDFFNYLKNRPYAINAIHIDKFRRWSSLEERPIWDPVIYFDDITQNNVLLSVAIKLSNPNVLENIHKEIDSIVGSLTDTEYSYENIKSYVVAKTLIGLLVIFAKVYSDGSKINFNVLAHLINFDVTSTFQAYENQNANLPRENILKAFEHFTLNHILHWACEIKVDDFQYLPTSVREQPWVNQIEIGLINNTSSPEHISLPETADSATSGRQPAPTAIPFGNPDTSDKENSQVPYFSWYEHRDIYFKNPDHANELLNKLKKHEDEVIQEALVPTTINDIDLYLKIITKVISSNIKENEYIQEDIMADMFSKELLNKQRVLEVRSVQTKFKMDRILEAEEHFDQIKNSMVAQDNSKTWEDICHGLRKYANTVLPHDAPVSKKISVILLTILQVYLSDKMDHISSFGDASGYSDSDSDINSCDDSYENIHEHIAEATSGSSDKATLSNSEDDSSYTDSDYDSCNSDTDNSAYSDIDDNYTHDDSDKVHSSRTIIASSPSFSGLFSKASISCSISTENIKQPTASPKAY